LVFLVEALLVNVISLDILLFFVAVGLRLAVLLVVLLTITDNPFFIWLFNVLHSFSDALAMAPPLA